jgi:hypothetical protein
MINFNEREGFLVYSGITKPAQPEVSRNMGEYLFIAH